MKNKLIRLWLCLLIGFLPLSTEARLTGEVIYAHPEYYDELWITRLEAPQRARLLFKHTHDIFEVATQRKGDLIVVISEPNDPRFFFDAYLVNTAEPQKKALNLTQKRFDEVFQVDISENGHVLLTNHDIGGAPPQHDMGVYLFPFTELKRPVPVPTLLKKVESGASRVRWLPNGKEIVYDTDLGVFLFDISTQACLRVCRSGAYPAVSPDGKMLAFMHRGIAGAAEIEIISLETFRTLKIIEDLVPHSAFIDLKFSPSGKYLVYTTYGGGFFNPNDSEYQHLAVPIDGSPAFKLLEVSEAGISTFDWWNTTYAVEPTKKITTLWGALKAANKR